MPLLPEVEELLKDYSEEDQKVLRPHYEAHPELQKKVKEQVMGTRDYSRKIQVVSEKEKEADKKQKEATALFDKNMEWFRSNTTEVEAMENRNKELETKIVELEKRAGSAPPSAENDKLLGAIEELKSKFTATEKLIADKDKENQQRMDGGGMFLVKLNDLGRKYEKEFGKDFSGEEFVKYMNENKLNDPDTAYKAMTEVDRQAKWEADKIKELETKIEADLRAKFATQNVPYATGGSYSEKGPLQQYINGGDQFPKTTTEAATRAAQELMAEGKG